MSDEYNFSIYIEPCLITSYDSLQTVSSIEYAIGALSLTGGSYAFVQTPECGYDESVTILNLPSFLTHNELSADFTVSALSDLSLIGEYTITVRSEIMVPTDYTKSSFDTILVEYNFPFRV